MIYFKMLEAAGEIGGVQGWSFVVVMGGLPALCLAAWGFMIADWVRKRRSRRVLHARVRRIFG